MSKKKSKTPKQKAKQATEGRITRVLLSVPGRPKGLIVNEGFDERLRFWTKGQKGPGSLELPLLLWLQREEEIFRASRGERPFSATEAAAIARQKNAKIPHIEAALRALDNPFGPKVAGDLAKLFDVGASYIRKIRAKRRFTACDGEW